MFQESKDWTSEYKVRSSTLSTGAHAVCNGKELPCGHFSSKFLSGIEHQD